MTGEERKLRNALYGASRCIVCAGPQSAGRPRCDECHMLYLAAKMFEPAMDRNKPGPCGVCETPDITRPGRVTCVGCRPDVGKWLR